MKQNKPEIASIWNTYRPNTFFPMTLLMGSMSCQNSLKMHFCSCDSGMSLILEVDVASATETTISILLLRDAKQPMAFAVWLLNLRWRCVDTSWIDLWIQLLSLEKVVIRCADGWSVETQTSSVQNVCLYIDQYLDLFAACKKLSFGRERADIPCLD